MAKSRPTITDVTVERAVQQAIHDIPGINDLPEAVYCEVVGSGLDAVLTGIKMREEELKTEDE